MIYFFDPLEKVSKKERTGLFPTFSTFFEKSMKKYKKVMKSKFGVFLMALHSVDAKYLASVANSHICIF